MGDYKEKNGTTRVGDFLRNIKGVAPTVLNLAANVPGLDGLRKLADVIKGDDTISPADKETALKLLELDIQEMQEISKRWASDMISDSWLSKNVRPITLLALLAFVFIFCIMDLFNNITVADVWIDLFKELLFVVIVAYFGSRGVEKFQKIRKQ